MTTGPGNTALRFGMHRARLLGALRSAARHILAARRRRKDLGALLALSDSALYDIGLTRGDLHTIVAQSHLGDATRVQRG